MLRRVGERFATPCITPSVSHGGGSVMVWTGLCQLQSQGFAPSEGQIESELLHRILQHHAIPSGTRLVNQGFVLMQGNDLEHTRKLCQKYIKRKEDQPVLQLMSWPAQSADINPLNWCGMNLTKNPELNNSQVQLTSGNSCKKVGKNLSLFYLQYLVEIMPRVYEAVIAAKRGHFDW